MRVAVLKETQPPSGSEQRVAIVPDSVKRLGAKKIDVSVESGAGTASYASDDDYKSLGATVEASRAALYAADVVVQIRIPTPELIAELREGSVFVSLLLPLVNHDLVRKLAEKKVTAIAVDMIPRTTL